MENKNSKIETSDEFFEKVDEIFQEIDKKAKKPTRQEEIEGEKIKADEQDEVSDDFIEEKIDTAEGTIKKPVHVHIKERERTEKINKLFSPRFKLLIAFSLIVVCAAIYFLFFKSEPEPDAQEEPVVRPPVIESFVINPQPAVKGETAQAAITLRTPALEGGAVVKLVPRESEAMNIPAEIRIPEGEKTGNFEIQISREAPNTISIEAQASSKSKMWASVSLNAPKKEEQRPHPPVPDIQYLPRVTGECSAEITTTPTATDYRSRTVRGTTNDPRVYTRQGTYTVTWKYTDEDENYKDQIQTVIVQDITPPVPDVQYLRTVTGKGSAEITTIPTATDNCSRTVRGTTNDPRVYTRQGTYTVTWKYDDGHGNYSTQTQTVKVIVEPTDSHPDLYVGALRSSGQRLSLNEVATMLKRHSFFSKQYSQNKDFCNPEGNFKNDFDSREVKGDKVVVDKVTGLMWHQSGSGNDLTYDKAKQWIKKLKRRGYAGYSDWRLPTLEEGASLIERSKMNGGLYIDPKFSAKQKLIWTSDTVYGSSARAWAVSFNFGRVRRFYVGHNTAHVRPVRSGR